MRSRPAVSVVVPFRGARADAGRALSQLAVLSGQGDDEVIIADNSDDGVVEGASRARREAGIALEHAVRIVAASAERSSYHARNSGAAVASNDWLLFLDADCTPTGGLLEAFFSQPIAEGCGAVAGQILGDPDQRSLAARYARSRNLFDHSKGLVRAKDGGAAGGNLLVRRTAFVDLGGFVEGIRSGGDVDFCRRLGRAGWSLEFRPDALVRHRHRDTVASLMGAVARYGAGARWLNDRYPGSSPRWPLLAGLLHAARDITRLAAGADLEAALFRAVDGIGLIAHNMGYAAGNEAGMLRGRSVSPLRGPAR